MYIVLITVHIIACLVLVMVILLQSGRGGGLSETFGASGSTIFGANTATFLQKATTVCAITFLVTSLSLAILSSRRSRSIMDLDKIKKMLPVAAKEEMPKDTPKDVLPLEDRLSQETEEKDTKE